MGGEEEVVEVGGCCCRFSSCDDIYCESIDQCAEKRRADEGKERSDEWNHNRVKNKEEKTRVEHKRGKREKREKGC